MDARFNKPRSIVPVFLPFGRWIFCVMIFSLAGIIGSIGICVKMTAEANWTKAKAEVVRTFIDHVNEAHDFGSLNVVYQYTFKGTPYVVTELVHDDKLDDLKMEQTVFLQRRTIDVCVNPANPAEARIDDTNLAKMIALFMGCAVVCGLGFAGSAAILFRSAPAESVVAPVRSAKMLNQGQAF